MKNFAPKLPIFLVYTYLVGIVLVLNSSPSSSWLEVENQEDFSYVACSANGPANWGNLRPEWAECKNGTKQSPIDLAYEKMQYAQDLGDLQMSYTPASATLKNRGHDISLKWDVAGSAGSIQINGITYVLDQFHWHSPSEHTINGRRFALELHMVHTNVQLRKVAVVSVLYTISIYEDPFISELQRHIMDISSTGAPSEVSVGLVDPNNIDMSDTRYFRYAGSLTTPPCTENVTWTIKRKVKPVTIDQVMLLRRAVHDGNGNNARPLQPLNNRDILYYSSGLKNHIRLPTSPLVDTM